MAWSVEERAKLSLGTSAESNYRAIAKMLAGRSCSGTLLDVGCGRGQLWPFVRDRCDRYTGVDVIKFDGFPADGEFVNVDLNNGPMPLPDDFADIVTAAGTIEYLENPRSFVRELTRLAKPGGWVTVTTSNQLSLSSKLGLLLRNEFPAFRGANYPAHLTALLEIDLRRIAAECGWEGVTVAYSAHGRVPGSASCWPAWMSRWFPRLLSDNVLLLGQKTNNKHV